MSWLYLQNLFTFFFFFTVCWIQMGLTSSTKLKKKALEKHCIPNKQCLVTQIDHEVLVYLSFSLEAGCKQEHPVVNGDDGKPSRRLDTELLRWDKLAPLSVPLVNLCQWIIAAQDGILPVADGDWLEHHGATGGKCLDLREHGTVPAHHPGVPDESCQAYEQVTFEKDKDSRDSLVFQQLNVHLKREKLRKTLYIITTPIPKKVGMLGKMQIKTEWNDSKINVVKLYP